MKVVVTGGAGFIGANLCKVLSEAGGDVVALDDLSTGNRRNLEGTPVVLAEGSILDFDFVKSTLKGAESIVHLAARTSVPRSLDDPLATHAANVTGTAILLEAARTVECRHLIIASSSSIYGDTSVISKNESFAPAPRSPYAATKLATEAYAIGWGISFGLDVLAFRFFNVFGPLQAAGHPYAAVVPTFIGAALSGQPLPVHGDGRQTRDFTFVDNVTMILSDAVERRISNPGPVNLAFGGRYSLLEVIEELEGILGRNLTRIHRPARKGDIRDSQADQTLLRSLFPDSIPTDFRTGLQRTVDWFCSEP